MNVSDLMSRELVTVSPLDSVEEAVGLLRDRHIRHLLVMHKSRLVGIISDHDIHRALDPNKTKKRMMNVGGLFFLLEPILVREIMTRDPVTVEPSATAGEAAAMMLKGRFNALPVVRGTKTLGIITETDLLRHFASLPEKSGATPRVKKKPAVRKSAGKAAKKPTRKTAKKKAARKKARRR